MSDSSDAPLIKDMQSKRNLRSPSTTSFESGIFSVSTHAFTDIAKLRSESPELMPNPFEPPTSKPIIPIIKEPNPPPKPVALSSLTTAEHQFSALVSRPSFLAKPRSAPRPSVRRAGSRAARDMRATALTRLASTRSGRRSRSVDAMDEADSPSSVYSQASAAPGYRSSVDFGTAFASEPAPPVPPLPTQYQPHAFKSAGWAHEAQPPRAAPPASPPLEDSHAFPLPLASPVHGAADAAPATPGAQWFATLWASPSSTSPSPSHSSPNEPAVLRTSASDGPSLRSLEVSRRLPQLQHAVGSQEEAHQGTVGYQLPPGWRAGASAVAMPTPQVYGYEDNTPRASTAAIVYHA
ncbi:hypothetical protein PsYK624_108880 [Phanerochaete sordida]|uniref:Uncharacterized protein n=1 Tax=Phanerochaete sordida TaxID=48140 RepID=A0A9P3GFH6_9APHY|nr:hypothetical protein PsYK624_108880 [Phanerochaete sordida]